MEQPTVQSAEIPEPLQLHDPASDDWVKPFGCSHVVVSFSPEKSSSKKKSKTKKKKVGDEKEILSFCVMCGETISDEELAEKCKTTSIDDIKGQGSNTSLQKTTTARENSKVRIFGSSRRSPSSSMVSLGQTASSPGTDPKSCPIHGHKKIKYFCEDHQEICCSVCVNVLHRACDRLMLIKDEVDTVWDPKVCDDTMSALDAIADSFEKIVEFNEKSEEELKEEVDAFKKSRENMRKRLLELLDEFDKISDKMLRKFVKISEQEIQSTIAACKEARSDAQASKELLEYVSAGSSKRDCFIATQKVLKQKNKYGIALSEAIKNCKNRAVDFIPQTCFTDLYSLKKIADIEFIAEAVVFPETVLSPVSKLPMTAIRTPRDIQSAFSRSESAASLESTITFLAKYNVRLPEDKSKCEIVGAAFLADDRVVIADMNNKKLKLFDPKFAKAQSVTLTSEPRGVTVISPTEIAVTLPDESKIQLVSTHKKLTTTRSILTSLPCYGITKNTNQELVVLCDDGFKTTAIQVLDLDGKDLKTLKMNQRGHVMLKNPWDLAVNLDGQQVCVTDRGKLVCIDLEGNHVFQYADENLVNARGVVVDELGRYYVCGTGSGNVHQVSADGKKTSVILGDSDVSAPQAAAYHKSKRLLLLTSVSEDNVYMYRAPR